MRKPLIIFGNGEIAQIAHFYFSAQSDYDVVAFTVDADYIKDSSFCGLPVIAFEDIENDFPPTGNHLFVAASYSNLNALRKDKYISAKSKGYSLAKFISPKAIILNNDCIGDNCFIFEGNVIQPFARIGHNVTLWSGNHIGHHSIINDHTFIASHVVVSGGVVVGEQCFIGVNATLRDHIKIGCKCIIGAGALLLDDAEPEGVYMGQQTPRSRVPSSRLRRI